MVVVIYRDSISSRAAIFLWKSGSRPPAALPNRSGKHGGFKVDRRWTGSGKAMLMSNLVPYPTALEL